MPYVVSRNGRARFIAQTIDEGRELARVEECRALGLPATHPGTDAPVEPIAWGGEYVIRDDGSVDMGHINPDVAVGGWWRVERVE